MRRHKSWRGLGWGFELAGLGYAQEEIDIAESTATSLESTRQALSGSSGAALKCGGQQWAGFRRFCGSRQRSNCPWENGTITTSSAAARAWRRGSQDANGRQPLVANAGEEGCRRHPHQALHSSLAMRQCDYAIEMLTNEKSYHQKVTTKM